MNDLVGIQLHCLKMGGALQSSNDLFTGGISCCIQGA